MSCECELSEMKLEVNGVACDKARESKHDKHRSVYGPLAPSLPANKCLGNE